MVPFVQTTADDVAAALLEVDDCIRELEDVDDELGEGDIVLAIEDELEVGDIMLDVEDGIMALEELDDEVEVDELLVEGELYPGGPTPTVEEAVLEIDDEEDDRDDEVEVGDTVLDVLETVDTKIAAS